jgi:glycosyltransferase involved in cell wall biosynthesis
VSDSLHVGVDALNLLHDRRGIWRYANALLRRYMHMGSERVRVTLLVPHAFPRLVARPLARALDCNDVIVRRRQDAAGLGLHLVWYPWNGMTWVSPCRNVATVHDVWPFASPAEDLRKRRSQQAPFRTTAAHAKVIITDSQFSKSEIVKYLAVSPQHIRVVALGVDAVSANSEQPILLDGASRYVLFVGENEPRKDLATLQAAMMKLPDALRMTTGLVIAGTPRASTSRGRVDVERHAGKQSIVLRFEPVEGVPTLVTGTITDELLQQLYGGAAAFVFPSRYEGFGLPVLEAMANGAPVLASSAASIPEVAGDAALYFPAGNDVALAHEMTQILSDRILVARLRSAGQSRASTFTWDRCAEETLRIFEAVASSAHI